MNEHGIYYPDEHEYKLHVVINNVFINTEEQTKKRDLYSRRTAGETSLYEWGVKTKMKHTCVFISQS